MTIKSSFKQKSEGYKAITPRAYQTLEESKNTSFKQEGIRKVSVRNKKREEQLKKRNEELRKKTPMGKSLTRE